jgi:hypothetical protein
MARPWSVHHPNAAPYFFQVGGRSASDKPSDKQQTIMSEVSTCIHHQKNLPLSFSILLPSITHTHKPSQAKPSLVYLHHVAIPGQPKQQLSRERETSLALFVFSILTTDDKNRTIVSSAGFHIYIYTHIHIHELAVSLAIQSNNL